MTKEQLRIILRKDKVAYGINLHAKVIGILTHDPHYRIYKALRASRICDWYGERLKNHRHNQINRLCYFYYLRKKCVMNQRVGMELNVTNVGGGLFIEHIGATVINGNAVIGENCMLHGNNCIGDKGYINPEALANDEKIYSSLGDWHCAKIGNNVAIGVGAKIIGNVTIADNIVIGAGAVVVSSFLEEGVTIAGIPAKKIK